MSWLRAFGCLFFSLSLPIECKDIADQKEKAAQVFCGALACFWLQVTNTNWELQGLANAKNITDHWPLISDCQTN